MVSVPRQSRSAISAVSLPSESTEPNSAGKNAKAGEFAIWNGFTLQVKYDGDVLYECTNIKIGLPDSAFEKNLDTSWAK